MSWTTMHYAVGMGCAGALTGTACLIFRRGWRFLPAAMTAGGVWALIPDLPRFFREDFPSLPFAGVLGLKSLERWLHRGGDLFCFHARLDAQPREYALAGLAIILILYNFAIALLMFLEYRQRNRLGNRAWYAHQQHTLAHACSSRRRHRHHHQPATDPDRPLTPPTPLFPTTIAPPPLHTGDAVIHRINPDDHTQAG